MRRIRRPPDQLAIAFCKLWLGVYKIEKINAYDELVEVSYFNNNDKVGVDVVRQVRCSLLFVLFAGTNVEQALYGRGWYLFYYATCRN